jgi:hypothetical protein
MRYDLPMPPDVPAKQEELRKIEAELLARLEAAQAEYREAKTRCDRLSQIRADVGSENPDGMAAYTQAMRIRGLAAGKYTEALRAFHRFVLNCLVLGDRD